MNSSYICIYIDGAEINGKTCDSCDMILYRRYYYKIMQIMITLIAMLHLPYNCNLHLQTGMK